MASPNEFKYTLTFESLSTGSGAKTTADGVDAVAAATDRLTRRQKDLMSEFSALSDRSDVTRTAYYDLGTEIDNTRRKQEKIPEENRKVAVSSRNTSMALLELSRGFEDAQYGIRGVLNNIPSLVLSLGGTAGLAGGISIAAVALSQIIPLFTSTAKSAEDTAERIKTIADSIGEAELDRFNDMGDAIEAQAAAAAALSQNWELTATAEAQYAATALENAEKIEQAQKLIAEALGLQVDRFKELEAIATREAEKRQLAAQQAIATEQRKLEAARAAVIVAADAATAQANRAASEEANLVKLRAENAALREKEASLKSIAALAAGGITPTLPGDLPDPDALKNFERGTEAQNTLDTGILQQQIAASQARLDKLEVALRSLTDEGTGAVDRAETAVIAAKTKFADVQAAVETNIRSIEDTLAADTLLARSQGLVQKGAEFAKSIQDTFSQVETSNAQGLAAKQNLDVAAADGKITADEMRGASESIRVLMGLLQSGQATYNGQLTDLLTIQNTFADDQTRLNNEIKSLKEKVLTLRLNGVGN